MCAEPLSCLISVPTGDASHTMQCVHPASVTSALKIVPMTPLVQLCAGEHGCYYAPRIPRRVPAQQSPCCSELLQVWNGRLAWPSTRAAGAGGSEVNAKVRRWRSSEPGAAWQQNMGKSLQLPSTCHACMHPLCVLGNCPLMLVCDVIEALNHPASKHLFQPRRTQNTSAHVCQMQRYLPGLKCQPFHAGYLGVILFEQALEQPLVGQTLSVTSLVDLEGAALHQQDIVDSPSCS